LGTELACGWFGQSRQEVVMLVLSRKKNESIVIADCIVVTVVDVRGDKVRLGIEAPREIPVHRSEVHAAIAARVNELKTEEEVVE
jgi:carbon storage regulator